LLSCEITHSQCSYKLAEKLSERLNEMGKDLGSMIEEVNSASVTLSKTNKADEPVRFFCSQYLQFELIDAVTQISQIVRILNSHLSQLQLIDRATAELQVKVSAAQKAGQALGPRISGYGYGSGGISLGNSAADDFYRSYMGRR
jgi:nuclear pore complex protein Nup62